MSFAISKMLLKNKKIKQNNFKTVLSRTQKHAKKKSSVTLSILVMLLQILDSTEFIVGTDYITLIISFHVSFYLEFLCIAVTSL